MIASARPSTPQQPIAHGLDLFTEASDYLIKQHRHLSRNAVLSRCINHLVLSGASRADAETAAIQAYANLATFNSRNHIDVDRTTSSLVILTIEGTPGAIALTADDVARMWRSQLGQQIKAVAV